ncbi:EndoU domain-containing protein [Kitasatospora sp. NE20-6]|uniref:EndoU domain-containing protein n=1 Tax=Kitasatospora sp. NE20-6 TaxID=2859066 RepID=UPI0038B2B550
MDGRPVVGSWRPGRFVLHRAGGGSFDLGPDLLVALAERVPVLVGGEFPVSGDRVAGAPGELVRWMPKKKSGGQPGVRAGADLRDEEVWVGFGDPAQFRWHLLSAELKTRMYTWSWRPKVWLSGGHQVDALGRIMVRDGAAELPVVVSELSEPLVNGVREGKVVYQPLEGEAVSGVKSLYPSHLSWSVIKQSVMQAYRHAVQSGEVNLQEGFLTGPAGVDRVLGRFQGVDVYGNWVAGYADAGDIHTAFPAYRQPGPARGIGVLEANPWVVSAPVAASARVVPEPVAASARVMPEPVAGEDTRRLAETALPAGRLKGAQAEAVLVERVDVLWEAGRREVAAGRLSVAALRGSADAALVHVGRLAPEARVRLAASLGLLKAVAVLDGLVLAASGSSSALDVAVMQGAVAGLREAVGTVLLEGVGFGRWADAVLRALTSFQELADDWHGEQALPDRFNHWPAVLHSSVLLSRHGSSVPRRVYDQHLQVLATRGVHLLEGGELTADELAAHFSLLRLKDKHDGEQRMWISDIRQAIGASRPETYGKAVDQRLDHLTAEIGRLEEMQEKNPVRPRTAPDARYATQAAEVFVRLDTLHRTLAKTTRADSGKFPERYQFLRSHGLQLRQQIWQAKELGYLPHADAVVLTERVLAMGRLASGSLAAIELYQSEAERALRAGRPLLNHPSDPDPTTTVADWNDVRWSWELNEIHLRSLAGGALAQQAYARKQNLSMQLQLENLRITPTPESLEDFLEKIRVAEDDCDEDVADNRVRRVWLAAQRSEGEWIVATAQQGGPTRQDVELKSEEHLGEVGLERLLTGAVSPRRWMLRMSEIRLWRHVLSAGHPVLVYWNSRVRQLMCEVGRSFLEGATDGVVLGNATSRLHSAGILARLEIMANGWAELVRSGFATVAEVQGDLARRDFVQEYTRANGMALLGERARRLLDIHLAVAAGPDQSVDLVGWRNSLLDRLRKEVKGYADKGASPAPAQGGDVVTVPARYAVTVLDALVERTRKPTGAPSTADFDGQVRNIRKLLDAFPCETEFQSERGPVPAASPDPEPESLAPEAHAEMSRQLDQLADAVQKVLAHRLDADAYETISRQVAHLVHRQADPALALRAAVLALVGMQQPDEMVVSFAVRALLRVSAPGAEYPARHRLNEEGVVKMLRRLQMEHGEAESTRATIMGFVMRDLQDALEVIESDRKWQAKYRGMTADEIRALAESGTDLAASVSAVADIAVRRSILADHGLAAVRTASLSVEGYLARLEQLPLLGGESDGPLATETVQLRGAAWTAALWNRTLVLAATPMAESEFIEFMEGLGEFGDLPPDGAEDTDDGEGADDGEGEMSRAYHADLIGGLIQLAGSQENGGIDLLPQLGALVVLREQLGYRGARTTGSAEDVVQAFHRWLAALEAVGLDVYRVAPELVRASFDRLASARIPAGHGYERRAGLLAARLASPDTPVEELVPVDLTGRSTGWDDPIPPAAAGASRQAPVSPGPARPPAERGLHESVAQFLGRLTARESDPGPEPLDSERAEWLDEIAQRASAIGLIAGHHALPAESVPTAADSTSGVGAGVLYTGDMPVGAVEGEPGTAPTGPEVDPEALLLAVAQVEPPTQDELGLLPGQSLAVVRRFEAQRWRRADGEVELRAVLRVFLDVQEQGITPEELADLRERALWEAGRAYSQGSRLPGGELLRVQVEFVGERGAAQHIVAVHRHQPRADHRNWGLNTASVSLAHELGHLLGFADEYREVAAAGPRTVYTDGSLMGGNYLDSRGRPTVDGQNKPSGWGRGWVASRHLRQLGAWVDTAFGKSVPRVVDGGSVPGGLPGRASFSLEVRGRALYGSSSGAGGHLMPVGLSSRVRPVRFGPVHANGTFRVEGAGVGVRLVAPSSLVTGGPAGDLAVPVQPLTRVMFPETRVMFPEYWTEDDAVYAAEQAYLDALRSGGTRPVGALEGVFRWAGVYGGVRIEGELWHGEFTWFRPADDQEGPDGESLQVPAYIPAPMQVTARGPAFGQRVQDVVRYGDRRSRTGAHHAPPSAVARRAGLQIFPETENENGTYTATVWFLDPAVRPDSPEAKVPSLWWLHEDGADHTMFPRDWTADDVLDAVEEAHRQAVAGAQYEWEPDGRTYRWVGEVRGVRIEGLVRDGQHAAFRPTPVQPYLFWPAFPWVGESERRTVELLAGSGRRRATVQQVLFDSGQHGVVLGVHLHLRGEDRDAVKQLAARLNAILGKVYHKLPGLPGGPLVRVALKHALKSAPGVVGVKVTAGMADRDGEGLKALLIELLGVLPDPVALDALARAVQAQHPVAPEAYSAQGAVGPVEGRTALDLAIRAADPLAYPSTLREPQPGARHAGGVGTTLVDASWEVLDEAFDPGERHRPSAADGFPGTWTAEDARFAAYRVVTDPVSSKDAGGGLTVHRGAFAGVPLEVDVRSGLIVGFRPMGGETSGAPADTAVPPTEPLLFDAPGPVEPAPAGMPPAVDGEAPGQAGAGTVVLAEAEVLRPSRELAEWGGALAPQRVRRFRVQRVRLADGRIESRLSVRIHLDVEERPAGPALTADQVREVQDRAVRALDEHYNTGARLPNGDLLRMGIEFVADAPDADHVVALLEHIEREHSTEWGFGSPPYVLAHEIGHFFGLHDEYREEGWHGWPVYSDGSLMTGYFVDGRGLTDNDTDYRFPGALSPGRRWIPPRLLRQLGAWTEGALGTASLRSDRGIVVAAEREARSDGLPSRAVFPLEVRRAVLYGHRGADGHLPPSGASRRRRTGPATEVNANGTFQVVRPVGAGRGAARATAVHPVAGDLAVPQPQPQMMFPAYWTEDDAVYAAEQAYLDALRNGGLEPIGSVDGAHRWTGVYGGVRIEGELRHGEFTWFRPAGDQGGLEVPAYVPAPRPVTINGSDGPAFAQRVVDAARYGDRRTRTGAHHLPMSSEDVSHALRFDLRGRHENGTQRATVHFLDPSVHPDDPEADLPTRWRRHVDGDEHTMFPRNWLLAGLMDAVQNAHGTAVQSQALRWEADGRTYRWEGEAGGIRIEGLVRDGQHVAYRPTAEQPYLRWPRAAVPVGEVGPRVVDVVGRDGLPHKLVVRHVLFANGQRGVSLGIPLHLTGDPQPAAELGERLAEALDAWYNGLDRPDGAPLVEVRLVEAPDPQDAGHSLTADASVVSLQDEDLADILRTVLGAGPDDLVDLALDAAELVPPVGWRPPVDADPVEGQRRLGRALEALDPLDHPSTLREPDPADSGRSDGPIERLPFADDYDPSAVFAPGGTAAVDTFPAHWTAEEAAYAAFRVMTRPKVVVTVPGSTSEQVMGGVFAGVELEVTVENGLITDYWAVPDAAPANAPTGAVTVAAGTEVSEVLLEGLETPEEFAHGVPTPSGFFVPVKGAAGFADDGRAQLQAAFSFPKVGNAVVVHVHTDGGGRFLVGGRALDAAEFHREVIGPKNLVDGQLLVFVGCDVDVPVKGGLSAAEVIGGLAPGLHVVGADGPVFTTPDGAVMAGRYEFDVNGAPRRGIWKPARFVLHPAGGGGPVGLGPDLLAALKGPLPTLVGGEFPVSAERGASAPDESVRWMPKKKSGGPSGSGAPGALRDEEVWVGFGNPADFRSHLLTAEFRVRGRSGSVRAWLSGGHQLDAQNRIMVRDGALLPVEAQDLSEPLVNGVRTGRIVYQPLDGPAASVVKSLYPSHLSWSVIKRSVTQAYRHAVQSGEVNLQPGFLNGPAGVDRVLGGFQGMDVYGNWVAGYVEAGDIRTALPAYRQPGAARGAGLLEVNPWTVAVPLPGPAHGAAAQRSTVPGADEDARRLAETVLPAGRPRKAPAEAVVAGRVDVLWEAGRREVVAGRLSAVVLRGMADAALAHAVRLDTTARGRLTVSLGLLKAVAVVDGLVAGTGMGGVPDVAVMREAVAGLREAVGSALLEGEGFGRRADDILRALTALQELADDWQGDRLLPERFTYWPAVLHSTVLLSGHGGSVPRRVYDQHLQVLALRGLQLVRAGEMTAEELAEHFGQLRLKERNEPEQRMWISDIRFAFKIGDDGSYVTRVAGRLGDLDTELTRLRELQDRTTRRQRTTEPDDRTGWWAAGVGDRVDDLTRHLEDLVLGNTTWAEQHRENLLKSWVLQMRFQVWQAREAGYMTYREANLLRARHYQIGQHFDRSMAAEHYLPHARHILGTARTLVRHQDDPDRDAVSEADWTSTALVLEVQEADVIELGGGPLAAYARAFAQHFVGVEELWRLRSEPTTEKFAEFRETLVRKQRAELAAASTQQQVLASITRLVGQDHDAWWSTLLALSGTPSEAEIMLRHALLTGPDAAKRLALGVVSPRALMSMLAEVRQLRHLTGDPEGTGELVERSALALVLSVRGELLAGSADGVVVANAPTNSPHSAVSARMETMANCWAELVRLGLAGELEIRTEVNLLSGIESLASVGGMSELGDRTMRLLDIHLAVAGSPAQPAAAKKWRDGLRARLDGEVRGYGGATAPVRYARMVLDALVERARHHSPAPPSSFDAEVRSLRKRLDTLSPDVGFRTERAPIASAEPAPWPLSLAPHERPEVEQRIQELTEAVRKVVEGRLTKGDFGVVARQVSELVGRYAEPELVLRASLLALLGTREPTSVLVRRVLGALLSVVGAGAPEQSGPVLDLDTVVETLERQFGAADSPEFQGFMSVLALVRSDIRWNRRTEEPGDRFDVLVSSGIQAVRLGVLSAEALIDRLDRLPQPESADGERGPIAHRYARAAARIAQLRARLTELGSVPMAQSEFLAHLDRTVPFTDLPAVRLDGQAGRPLMAQMAHEELHVLLDSMRAVQEGGGIDLLPRPALLFLVRAELAFGHARSWEGDEERRSRFGQWLAAAEQIGLEHHRTDPALFRTALARLLACPALTGFEQRLAVLAARIKDPDLPVRELAPLDPQARAELAESLTRSEDDRPAQPRPADGEPGLGARLAELLVRLRARQKEPELQPGTPQAPRRAGFATRAYGFGLVERQVLVEVAPEIGAEKPV